MLRLVLVVFAVLLIIGMLPAWPYSAGWGYYPSGGALLITLLVLAILLSNRRGGVI